MVTPCRADCVFPPRSRRDLDGFRGLGAAIVRSVAEAFVGIAAGTVAVLVAVFAVAFGNLREEAARCPARPSRPRSCAAWSGHASTTQRLSASSETIRSSSQFASAQIQAIVAAIEEFSSSVVEGRDDRQPVRGGERWCKQACTTSEPAHGRARQHRAGGRSHRRAASAGEAGRGFSGVASEAKDAPMSCGHDEVTDGVGSLATSASSSCCEGRGDGARGRRGGGHRVRREGQRRRHPGLGGPLPGLTSSPQR